MTHAHTRRAVAAGFATAATAATLGLGLAACVPVASTPQAPGVGGGVAPGVGGGPGFAATPSNGVWVAPAFASAGSPWNTSEGALHIHNVEGSATQTTIFIYAVYDDGTRLAWGTLDYATGKWQGNWARAGGPVACPLPLPPPPQLVGDGFQFLQPLYVWGTFDVNWREPDPTFDGSWGGCGLPLGAPWTGRAAGF